MGDEVATCPHVLGISSYFSLIRASNDCNILFVHHPSIQFTEHLLGARPSSQVLMNLGLYLSGGLLFQVCCPDMLLPYIPLCKEYFGPVVCVPS